MKSIKYILLAIMLSSILVAAIPINTKKIKSKSVKYTLECIDQNAKKEDIVKSVIIYKKRLHSADLKFKILLKDDNTILVASKSKDSTRVKSLLNAEGYLGFYLPYLNQEGIEEILQNKTLLSLFDGKINFTDHSDAIILKVSDENKSKVDDIFREEILSKSDYNELVIAWSKIKNEDGLWELHLLTSDNYLDGSYIQKSYAQSNRNTKAIEIMIEFSDEGSKLWSDLTNDNINRLLAIVIDGKVYSAPKIMSKISGGKAMISGNFTENEAIDLAALIQSGRLPLKFKIIE